jgi:hypothetical protein
MLSEARKFAISIVSANQFLDQYPPEMRAAILAVGTHAYFQLSSSDAQQVSTALDGGKSLAEILKNLPRRNFVVKTGAERWQQAVVPTLAEPKTDPADLYARCRVRWARTRNDIEAEIGERQAIAMRTGHLMTGNRKGIILQNRDLQLLRELAVLPVVDREQAKCIAGFGSTTRVNARLLALARAGLLRRFFLGTTASGRKALYSLSKRGAQLVEVPYRGLRRGIDETVVVDFFVAHQLRINEVYCTVKYRPIPTSGVQFVQWRSFYESIDSVSPLVPDAYVELKTLGKTVAAFLEIDLGSETRSVWRAKIQSYLSYAASGNFERQFAHPQFRTLVVTSSARRLS